MTKDEALKLAQIALEDTEHSNFRRRRLDALIAIKQALAQPEQEPIAWAEFDGEGGYHFWAYEDNEDYAEQWDKRNPNHVGWVKPLYTTPPQRTWVGLTNAEVNNIAAGCHLGNSVQDAIFRAEAKLKEKNT